jgi:hypothetical protein
MVTLIEAVGWLAVAFGSHAVLPVSAGIDKFNNRFAHRVDAGNSCWDRVSGESGVYGGPHEFTLDALCNYRIETYEEPGTVTKWRLIRD